MHIKAWLRKGVDWISGEITYAYTFHPLATFWITAAFCVAMCWCQVVDSLMPLCWFVGIGIAALVARIIIDEFYAAIPRDHLPRIIDDSLQFRMGILVFWMPLVFWILYPLGECGLASAVLSVAVLILLTGWFWLQGINAVKASVREPHKENIPRMIYEGIRNPGIILLVLVLACVAVIVGVLSSIASALKPRQITGEIR